MGTLAKDVVRHHKNLGIVTIALAARSAIKGGIHPEVAFTMSDAYTTKLESLNNIAEIDACYRKAEYDYCELVKNNQNQDTGNPLVHKTETLLRKNMHKKIKISEIAKELNVTPDYLNRSFRKSKGISISNYILDEKIRYAKERLIYTEDDIKAIGYSFGFSSQSHFGDVFKKRTGFTPAEYRKRYKAE